MREGKLEIKYRIDNYSFVNTSGAVKVERLVENWIKWEWKDNQVEDLQIQSVKEDDTEHKKLWIKVLKERKQRKYKISQDKNNTLQPVVDKNENADCAVELTQLMVLDKIWWTIGFDYFIDKYDRKDNRLGFIIDWILKDYPDTNLNMNNSYGYPKWLLTFHIY